MEISFILWILPESMNLPDIKRSMKINYGNGIIDNYYKKSKYLSISSKDPYNFMDFL